jgi:hypothetical protein
MKTFSKFGVNRFGIVNSKGEVVSEDYLRRYIHCWCRKDDPMYNVPNRGQIIDHFMSDEFLSKHLGKTASQIGKIASIDPIWGSKPVVSVDPHEDMIHASLIDAQ